MSEFDPDTIQARLDYQGYLIGVLLTVVSKTVVGEEVVAKMKKDALAFAHEEWVRRQKGAA